MLGQCRATHGAIHALAANDTAALVLIVQHANGQWGELSDHDKQMNDAALEDGSRILSSYRLEDGTKLWVITDAQNDDGIRESTCIMLPEEY